MEERLDTTRVLRSALAGDDAAWEWVVRRISPLLVTQAEHRMHPRLRQICDPEDVVAEAWLRALPVLRGEFSVASGRCTPRVVALLAKTVQYRILELLRKLTPNSKGRARSESALSLEDAGVEPAGRSASPVKALMVADDVVSIVRLLRRLDDLDRNIVVLRLVEGVSARDVAERTGMTESAIHTRLSRALQRLRGECPDGIFDEFDDEDGGAPVEVREE